MNDDNELNLDFDPDVIRQYFEPLVEDEQLSTVPQQTPVDAAKLKKIVEGAILAAAQPLTVSRIQELFEESFVPTKEAIEEALVALQSSYADHGIELKEVASGWRFQVRDELAPWINKLWEERPQKYSRALLETLALVAYRQPITRGDIEDIRGVAVSSNIIRTLVERDWIKVVGQRDVPGRPSLYATTKRFLDYFNLKSLDELPSLAELRNFDEIDVKMMPSESSDAMPESANAEADNLQPADQATSDTTFLVEEVSAEKVNDEESSNS